MYDRILVPTDGSSGTDETLGHALHIAADNDATVHALYVVDRRLFLAADEDTQDDVIATLEEEGEAALDATETGGANAGVEVVGERREGIPHTEIMSYAEEIEADLLVMGTHGRTGRDRLASLGSVTERVVENVGRPTLVVDIGDGED
ncbi:universal stress protein [Halorientalis pallida]|uniref:Universal stress protein n=1 Tax=Halorientalis pallida TaxID=2479928 RepID=A0A498L400_9EURY|nr:universal stress protein [Halorientalis pallida]RXK52061.1 universal stress protein [Halorientalis pallida]